MAAGVAFDEMGFGAGETRSVYRHIARWLEETPADILASRRAQAEYKTLTKDGTACIACGDCMPACRADINIVAKLKEVHKLLG